MTNRTISSAGAFAAACSLMTVFAGGCDSGATTDTTEVSSAAIKAVSAACSSARAACSANVQPIADGIKTACAPVETACAHQGGAAGAGGAAADCAAARAACDAAIVTAKPKLMAVGEACEASIEQACVVDLPDAGEVRGTLDGGDRDRGRGADGGHDDHGESPACEAAEVSCRTSLQSLVSMPPPACASIHTACGGQPVAGPSDACKTAVEGCHDALEASAKAAHDTCGADLAAACSHGG